MFRHSSHRVSPRGPGERPVDGHLDEASYQTPGSVVPIPCPVFPVGSRSARTRFDLVTVGSARSHQWPSRCATVLVVPDDRLRLAGRACPLDPSSDGCFWEAWTIVGMLGIGHEREGERRPFRRMAARRQTVERPPPAVVGHRPSSCRGADFPRVCEGSESATSRPVDGRQAPIPPPVPYRANPSARSRQAGQVPQP